jgi:hypothetical protein
MRTGATGSFPEAPALDAIAAMVAIPVAHAPMMVREKVV